MRFVRAFLLCLSWNLGLLSLAVAQPSLNSQAQALPEVTVSLVARDRQPSNTGMALLHIAVLIPPNYHGYLDTGDEGFFIPLSFAFPSLEAQGARVVMVSRPAGERDEVVHAIVLRGSGEFAFRIEATPLASMAADTLPMTFRYQICNDVTKICYPPQEVAIPLHTTPLTGDGSRNATTPVTFPRQPRSASLTLNERLTGLFQHYIDNLLLAFGFVFIAGLLASATPCVYPMLPITAAIFTARGEGSWQRGWLHAVVYFMGLISFYTLLGFIAATTGTALSVMMTNAWVHLGFAVLFAYLGLSMLGLHEFQLLAPLMTKLDTITSRWRGFSGTFCLGATTGLVVSPCVGPITGAILLDITGQVAGADTMSGSKTISVLLHGVILMTSFGLGLGCPFLIVGLLSSKLPQAGTWLTKTKYLLALPTLYFAYTYYMKGMEIAAIPLNVAHTSLIGMIALGTAAFLVGFHRPQSRRSQYTSSIILLLIGLYCMYTSFGRSWRMPDTSQASPWSVETSENLRWWRNFPLAQQYARAEQKPIFVDFYATWCANCKAFQRLTVRDAQLNAALQEVILVKIYDTDAGFQTLQRDPHYPELRGVGGQPLLPLFAIYSAQGVLVWKGQDYQAVHTIVAQLERAKRIEIP
jgi:thiol:disulfide interchange protein DsbD